MSIVSTNSKDGELVVCGQAAITSEVIRDSGSHVPTGFRWDATIVFEAGGTGLHEGLLITIARTGPDVTRRDVC